jgi:CDP-diacylglycerol--glycerol-3-phosphate 3-phosphatidyltransferase
MITVSNSLSFLRIPLAFLFLSDNSYLRCFAVVLAMISDSVDGYIARRNHSVTQFGAILDPVTDKFFVYFALTVLFIEGRLQLLQMIAMLSRDVVIGGYGLIMMLMGRTKSIVFRSLRAGKVATALQFCVLIGLVFQISFTWITYSAFVVVGSLAFLELFQTPKQMIFPRKS